MVLGRNALWAIGVVLGAIGLLALFIAAQIAGPAGDWVGLAVFGLCALGIFWVLQKGFDAAGYGPRDSEDAAHR